MLDPRPRDWPFGNLTPRRYGVILADPPWKFKTWSEKGNGKPCPYPTMTLDEIAALPVGSLSNRNCMLVMWTTAPFLPAALTVMDAWGFKYATMGCWEKLTVDGDPAIGTGYYWRSSAEPWIVGTRGSPGRWRNMAVPNIISARRREHSRKPDRLYSDLDRAYPGVEKAELFARSTVAGWDCWGNQVDLFDNEVAA